MLSLGGMSVMGERVTCSQGIHTCEHAQSSLGGMGGEEVLWGLFARMGVMEGGEV